MEKVDFGKLRKNFTGLVNFAKGLKEKNKNIKPVFSEVPAALKDVATKITTVVSDLKARLTFDFLDESTDLRSMGLDGSDNNKNIVTITDWIVSALKHVLTRVERHGEILTVHTEALAKPDIALSVAKDEEIKTLKGELVDLTQEIDETRQRGIKGNLIVSSPQSEKANTIAHHETVRGKRESDTDMIIRLILNKTGVTIDEKDVIACHQMGKKESHTYVIRLGNRRQGSAWHILTEGMMTGKNPSSGINFDKGVNLYLNFQLTKKRAKLAKAVRQARTAQKIFKYYINQNGIIKVKKTNTFNDKYIEVKSEAQLNTMINS